MRIAAGDDIVVDDIAHVVVALRGQEIVLHNTDSGQTTEILIRDLFRTAVVTAATTASPRAAADIAALAYMSPKTRVEVNFWAEALRQLDQELDGRTLPPSIVIARALERLARAGHPVTARTLQRKRQAFRDRGILGLVDKRDQNARPRTTDPRVAATLAAVIESQETQSSGNRKRLIFLTRVELDSAYGRDTVPMPSDRTMLRLIAEHRLGDGAVGSARSRRTRSNQPDRDFSALAVTRPGEQVQIDSTRLDVMVRVGENIARRPELTILIDTVTRTILAAVMRLEGTKSVDLIVALAKALVPYDARPGAEADSPRAAFMRQMPYIFPETITTDNGKVFISETFTNACEHLGISLNLAAPYTPTDKAKVERMFAAINSGFTQYVKGYTGRSVEYRGAEEDPATLHSLLELQDLFEEWVAVVWQNRRHRGLVDPLNPASMISPNEKFEILSQLMPQARVPFDTDTYIRLLPVEWRTIQPYGVSIGNRLYDSAALRPLRGTNSTLPGQGGKWPVHVDPHNVQTVWLRTESGLLPLPWSNAEFSGPMTAEVYALARTPEFFQRRASTRADVAERGREILERAAAGSAGRRQQIASARGEAVAGDPMRLSSAQAVAPPPPPPIEPADERELPRLHFEILDIAQELGDDDA